MTFQALAPKLLWDVSAELSRVVSANFTNVSEDPALGAATVDDLSYEKLGRQSRPVGSSQLRGGQAIEGIFRLKGSRDNYADPTSCGWMVPC